MGYISVIKCIQKQLIKNKHLDTLNPTKIFQQIDSFHSIPILGCFKDQCCLNTTDGSLKNPTEWMPIGSGGSIKWPIYSFDHRTPLLKCNRRLSQAACLSQACVSIATLPYIWACYYGNIQNIQFRRCSK